MNKRGTTSNGALTVTGRVAAALLAVVLTVGGVALRPGPALATAGSVGSRPVLYLTFDDGPGVDTPRFLDLLARYGIRATFFATGTALSAHPAMAQRIAAEGHAIANHSWSHPRLTALGDAAIRTELASTTDLIRSVTGVTATCYRPPYGATDARVHAQAVSVGLTNAEWLTGVPSRHYGLWDIDTNDWRLSVAGTSWTEAAMRAQLDQAGDGDTILMHDGYVARPRGLAVLSQWLADNANRFEFRTLPGCGGGLREPPYDPAHPQDWHRFRIARLYRAYFDRAPDDAGWEYWNRVYSQGHTLIAISDWFAQGSELASAGTLTHQDLVRLVYQRVLHREPDVEGERYWLDLLDRGQLTPGGLVVWFSESQEYTMATLAVMTGGCHDGAVESSYACWAAQLPVYHW